MQLDYIFTYDIFNKNHTDNVKIANILGQINLCLYDLYNISVLPHIRNRLLRANMAGGIMAMLASNGIPVSKEEIEQILDGKSLPGGKKLLEDEVKKLWNFCTGIYRDKMVEQLPVKITPDFIKKIREFSHKDKEPEEDKKREEIVNEICDWLAVNLNDKKERTAEENIIQAIGAGIIFELSNPFASSNNMVARMFEYSILINGGIPGLISFILPVYYYESGLEFKKQVELAQKTKDIRAFIEYALNGFKDGLKSIIQNLQTEQLLIIWQQYISIELDSDETAGTKITERRKELMLGFPLATDKGLSFDEIIILTTSLAKTYSRRAKTARRDVAALVDLGLLTKHGKRYNANIVALLGEMALKSSIVKAELLKGKSENYSAHVLPTISALEIKSELLQTLTFLRDE